MKIKKKINTNYEKPKQCQTQYTNRIQIIKHRIIKCTLTKEGVKTYKSEDIPRCILSRGGKQPYRRRIQTRRSK